MKILFAFLVFLTSCSFTSAQFINSVKRIYSTNVKDSFDIYTSLPANYSAKTKYDVIYYCDANLKSGNELRDLVAENKELTTKGNYIFIGIGHTGNYPLQRRRDFILPSINNSDTVPKSVNYGHAKDFYQFLATELIPSVQSSYNCSGKKSILGHSLGGLFVFYCLFQNERIFSNYFALSPSLWVDSYRVYDFNKLKDSVAVKSYLYMSAGSKETLNFILTGTNNMDEFLKIKKYANLQYEYQVHPGKTHMSQVPESLKVLLEKL